MATSEIDGAYGIPRDIHTFTDNIQQVLHDIGGQLIVNDIKPSSSQRYAHISIQRLKINEETEEGQEQTTITGMK